MQALPVFHHPRYSALELPVGHQFPIGKYRALFESLQGLPIEPILAEPIALELILAVHDRDYVRDFLSGKLPEAALRRIGFPWSPVLVERALLSLGATVAAARRALETGCALQTSGGYHHAHADHGGGYCIFNDLVIAAKALVAEGRVRRVLILDLDAHQGDGSAALAAGRRELVTVSLHGDRLYPVRKPPSDLDLPLPAGTGDAAYLEALETALGAIRGMGGFDLILYQAGVDIHEGDALGRFAVSSQGIRERERRVLRFARAEGIPIATVPGGGYRRDWEALVALHRILFEEAAALFCPGAAS